METSNINIADNFFGMIKNLSTEVRLELISRISETLKESTKDIESSESWKSLFGAFDSDQSADEMINDLRNSRYTHRDIENL